MTSEEIKAELTKLGCELNERRKDIALMERLRTAAADVKRITDTMTKLTADLNRVWADEAKARKDALASRYRDVSITGNGDPGRPLRTVYTISYDVATGHDPKTAEGWTHRSIIGFQALNPDVIRYILDFAPHALPPEITALSPGNPHDALERYYGGLHRGYLTA